MSGRDWITRARQMYDDGYDAADFLPKALDALEATLAEHEPGDFGPVLGVRCRRCITGSAGYAVPTPFPCQTVRAIEAALEIET